MVQAISTEDEKLMRSPTQRCAVPEVAFYREAKSVEELLEFLSSPAAFVKEALSNGERTSGPSSEGECLNQPSPSLPEKE